MEERYKNEKGTTEQQLKVIGAARVAQTTLTTSDLYEPALVALNNELKEYITVNVEMRRKSPWRAFIDALTNVLGRLERKYGIGGGLPIYYGVLSAESFGEMATQGKLFKDVGAGNLHGEYTHRLQWYILLYYCEKDSNYLGITPREFLIGINTLGLKLSKKEFANNIEGFGTLWDAVFDRERSRVGKGDGVTCPEVFNEGLMEGAFKGVDKLSEIVKTRYEKREREKMETQEGRTEYAKRKLKEGRYGSGGENALVRIG